jgi:hypothetical protein
MEQIEKCISFLENNGYKKIDLEASSGSDYQSFVHKSNISDIDVGENEIVFINDEGDWLHIPCNYFALIGACIHYSQIGIGYKH